MHVPEIAMSTLVAPFPLVRPSPALVERAARTGMLVAITTGALTAVTPGIAVATPLFPAIPLTVAVVALFVCVDRLWPARFRIFSQLGLWLGAAGALIIAADSFVQLAVIPPSLSAGEGLSVAALSQC